MEEDREDMTGVGEGFSEMFLKNKENIGLLLQVQCVPCTKSRCMFAYFQYVEEFDFKIRRPAVQLLSDLLTNCTRYYIGNTEIHQHKNSERFSSKSWTRTSE